VCQSRLKNFGPLTVWLRHSFGLGEETELAPQANNGIKGAIRIEREMKMVKKILLTISEEYTSKEQLRKLYLVVR
ncbi:hypothetical protein LCGC14_3031620, partial [marine sediment metagenome]